MHEVTQLYDLAPALFVLLDWSGLIVDINLRGCRLLGARRPRMIGMPFRTWVFESDRRQFLDHISRCQRGAEVVETELRLKSASGSGITTRLYSRMAAFGGRKLLPTMGFDLSEYQLLEEARQNAIRQRDRAESERMLASASAAAKDQLIAMVSHELRNPLSPALAAADALSASQGLPSHARQLAEVIKRNILLEAQLVNDLLDVARVTRGQLDLHRQSVDLHQIITDALATCRQAAESRKITMSLDLRARAHHTDGDDARLRQVFWNLLYNSIKFSDEGSSVHVRTSNEDGMIRVAVRDFGVGMDADTVNQLFQPFERKPAAVQRGGLGLGLTIARGIVEAHGGSIWAMSDGEGRGSTFEVDLAVVDSPRHAEISSPPESIDSSRSESGDQTATAPRSNAAALGRVLIVEDHQDTGTLMSMVLSQTGYDVTLVQSYAEALRELPRGWDVVLSDIGLPDGSGLDVARAARALPRPPARMIALSGFGASRDVQASRQAGFDDHLVKPVDLHKLVTMMTPEVFSTDSA